MSEAYKCDNCGKHFDTEHSDNFPIKVGGNNIYLRCYAVWNKLETGAIQDICDECMTVYLNDLLKKLNSAQ